MEGVVVSDGGGDGREDGRGGVAGSGEGAHSPPKHTILSVTN
jgi:hypothetical protein